MRGRDGERSIAPGVVSYERRLRGAPQDRGGKLARRLHCVVKRAVSCVAAQRGSCWGCRPPVRVLRSARARRCRPRRALRRTSSRA